MTSLLTIAGHGAGAPAARAARAGARWRRRRGHLCGPGKALPLLVARVFYVLGSALSSHMPCGYQRCKPSRLPAVLLQLAKARGLWVAATCSGRNADFVQGLGADEVVDYTSQDFAGGSPALLVGWAWYTAAASCEAPLVGTSSVASSRMAGVCRRIWPTPHPPQKCTRRSRLMRCWTPLCGTATSSAGGAEHEPGTAG